MKMTTLALAASAFVLSQAAGRAEIKVDVVRSTIINDTIPNAQIPMGVVRVGEESLLSVFSDGGDLEPGGKSYLVRSDDLGVTWSEPYQTISSENPADGVGGALATLPNGDILLTEIVMTHHSGDLSPEAVFKSRAVAFRLKVSSDGGKTFQPFSSLPSAPGANGAVMGTLVQLANGDLIIPAYQYPGTSKDEGHDYGSGFYRSTDGGKTWGRLEIAFADPVPGREKRLDFNESAYVVRPDGSIVAYARIDSEVSEEGRWQSKGNNMWVIESRDNGQTWTTPKETNIGGIFPAILRLDDKRYLLVCGDRQASPTRKVTFYTSTDGLNFQPAGFAPYVRTKGECLSSGTGGAQGLVRLSDDEVYLVYYAADPNAVPSRDRTHVEGCLLSVD